MLHSEDAPHSNLVRTLFARRSYEIDVRVYSAASLRGEPDAVTVTVTVTDADAITEFDAA
jgi:hypothetical protein